MRVAGARTDVLAHGKALFHRDLHRVVMLDNVLDGDDGVRTVEPSISE